MVRAMTRIALCGLFTLSFVVSSRVQSFRGVDVGKGLPAVPALLNASSHTLGKISAQVKKIHDHVGGLAEQQKAALAQQKAEYEAKLQQEVEENHKLEDENEHTSTEIWDLEKNNDGLRKHAKELQDSNAKLRQALETVQSKISGADDYINASLVATNDDGAKDLKVLGTKVQADSEEDDEGAASGSSADGEASDSESKGADAADDAGAAADTKASESQSASEAADAGSDEDGDQASLIAVSRRSHRISGAGDTAESDDSTDDQADDATNQDADSSNNASSVAESDPNDGDAPAAQADSKKAANTDGVSQNMLKALTTELDQLAQEDARSRAELTRLFQSQYKKGQEEKKTILDKQEALNSTRTELLKTKNELTVAVSHLDKTNQRLQKRLQGLGQYLGALASFARQPAAEAEKAIPTLPDSVSAFLETSKHSRHAEVSQAAAAPQAK